MIKKLLSISVASLALVACSSDIDELAPSSNGSDNLIELQSSTNNASARVHRPIEDTYTLTASTSSTTYITGTFYSPIFTENAKVVLFLGSSIVAQKPITSCEYIEPLPESEIKPDHLRGFYDFRGSFYTNTTYTVKLVINGNVVKTATVTTPSYGGGSGSNHDDLERPIFVPVEP